MIIMWFPDYKYGFILNSHTGLFTQKGNKDVLGGTKL